MKLNLRLCLSYLIFLFASFECAAQDCKYVEEKKDEFTNQSLKNCHFSIGKGGQIILQKKGEMYSIGFLFVVSGFVDKKLVAGDTIYVKLADDKMVNLAIVKDIDPILNGSNGSPYTE